MKYLLTGKQMQMSDQYTINELNIPSLTLMERAANTCVDILHQEKISLEKVLIVCGVGNNGGDGFAIGRILRSQGYDVTIYFVGDEKKRSVDCCRQEELYQANGGVIIYETPKIEYTVIIDAVFGVGLSREIQGKYKDVIQWMNVQKAFRFAVDIPSGICANTGKVFGIAFQAHMTVTFQNEKIGMSLFPGKEYAGRIFVRDIGIKNDVHDDPSKMIYDYELDDYRALMPVRKENSHKGTYGKVLIVAGSKGMSGAAFFNACAAYLTGAGLVQIYTHEDNRVILQQLLPEAIIKTYDSFDENEVLKLLEWADVLCVGSGLGQSPVSQKILTCIIDHNEKPCVLDADAINMISSDFRLLDKVNQSFYLFTPHMKELSRLLKVSVHEIKDDRIDMINHWMNQHKGVYVIKDANTMIFERGKPGVLNRSGNSAMAKAGSGDVLAGIIAGVLAQKKNCYESAVLGVYLHGRAGDYARDKKGVYSVMANDLLDGIISAIKELT